MSNGERDVVQRQMLYNLAAPSPDNRFLQREMRVEPHLVAD